LEIKIRYSTSFCLPSHRV